MKKALGLILAAVVLGACQKNEAVSEFTGNQATYALQAGSSYPISGTVIFKERKDGAVTISVKLTGTSAGTVSPVHLHMGDIGTDKAAVAALLTPVDGKTGTSETILRNLSDDSAVSYQRIIQLDACVKVHLSDTGAGRDIILAAGNVGTATTKATSGGRLGVAVCASP